MWRLASYSFLYCIFYCLLSLEVSSLNCFIVRGPRDRWIICKNPTSWCRLCSILSTRQRRFFHSICILPRSFDLSLTSGRLLLYFLNFVCLWLANATERKFPFFHQPSPEWRQRGELRSDPPDQDQNNRSPGQNLSLNAGQAELVCSVIFFKIHTQQTQSRYYLPQREKKKGVKWGPVFVLTSRPAYHSQKKGRKIWEPYSTTKKPGLHP